ncbi:MAG: RNA-directed DNA polymerase [Dolichospermum sp. JUN01]|nr:RNA-directed DNA polymerase [Dolichospermum sp. JUN01]
MYGGSMGVLGQLLSKGYFPKELPPAFTTEKFARAVTQASFNPNNCLVAPNNKGNLASAKNGTSQLCKHNIARLDGTSRPLHIPHPSHFFYLCQELDIKWAEVEAHLRQSTLSISIPKSDPNSIRAYIPSESGSARPNRRMKDRAQGNTLLIADIANFYGTVYTHSIPWALDTKPVAKSDRENLNRLGNALDKYVQNGQDGQTSGIPIGTDTSFIIAEIILSSIDKTLQEKHPGLVGFRFYDDYELICDDEFSARQILADLETQVAEYELALNHRKTKIIRLPDEIDHLWLTDLRQFQLVPNNRNKQREHLIDFANLVLSLSKRYPNDPILRYALVLVKSKSPTEFRPQEFWDIYQNFLLQIFRSEPQVSHLVAGELLKYKSQGVTIDKISLQKAIYSHISHYASTRATNEIAWALWMARLFEINMDDKIASKLVNIPDNVVAILSLEAQNKGLFTSILDTSLWQSKLTETNIYSEDWLLVYEAAAKGWLTIADGSNYIRNHQCFRKLNSDGVSFYDESSYGNVQAILKQLEINTDLYGM